MIMIILEEKGGQFMKFIKRWKIIITHPKNVEMKSDIWWFTIHSLEPVKETWLTGSWP